MSNEFASAGLTAGQLNAIVKKLGGHNAAMRFLRGQLTVSEQGHCWREQDGVICFSVTSDGTTGPEWIRRFEEEGFRVDDYAKSMLCSPDFKPTNGIKTEIAVLKGRLFKSDSRTTEKFCAEAGRRHLTKPNAEVACLIREIFLDKEIEAMGVARIVVMHEPIKDSDGDSNFLGVRRDGAGCCLDAFHSSADEWWEASSGFAFVVPQA